MLRTVLYTAVGIVVWSSIAHAQTSTERVEANLGAEYQLMKKVLAAKMGRQRPHRGVIDMYCFGADPVYYSGNSTVSAIGILAAYMVFADASLRRAKYPSSIWQHHLSAIENNQLGHIKKTGEQDSDTFGKDAGALIDAVDEYRNQSNPKLPRFEWEVACGGHVDRSFKIVTRPRGRSVRYMHAWYHQFCVAQGINAKDFTRCNLWSNVSDGDEIEASGAVMYQVSLRDGSYTEPKRHDFSKMPRRTTIWRVVAGP